MGLYLNPGNVPFKESLRSKIYVDKTGLIGYTNEMLSTNQKYICVSRPRRFGKSMTVEMLTAYYSRGCDSVSLFENTEISKKEGFKEHLNRYDVLRLDIQWLRGNALDAIKNGYADNFISFIQEEVIGELRQEYPDCVDENEHSLAMALADINNITKKQFVILIDEWDCLFREDEDNLALQMEYIEFLRRMFKGSQAEEFVKLAYMTGILPIKKYGTQSALNNFNEFTMVDAGVFAKYVCFTEAEVRALCEQHNMDFKEMRRWYDGYRLGKVESVYNPKSVVQSIMNEECGNYWTGTDTYEVLRLYIDMNFDGLKDAVIRMLAGGRCRINPQKFQNDMTSLKSKDDVMTLLVHLGYLAYDSEKREVFIPNQEVSDEFENAVTDGGWEEIEHAIRESEDLLTATIDGDEELVAERLDEIHMANTSVLSYNNEDSLSCAITIAYYSARREYTLIRELPAGKGFADIVFVPRKHSDKPAMIVELKWNQDAEGAIAQIKDRKYIQALEECEGRLLLVGINYDKRDKKHSCIIEKWDK